MSRPRNAGRFAPTYEYTDQDVLEAYDRHQGEVRAAKALGMPRATFQARLRRARRAAGLISLGKGRHGHGKAGSMPVAKGNQSTATVDSTRFRSETEGDNALMFWDRTPVQDADELLRLANVDLEQWEPFKKVVNQWEGFLKNEDNEAVRVPLFQVKVWLKRRAPDPLAVAMESVCERLVAGKLAHPAPLPPVRRKGNLLEIALYDHHFGKLAWAAETGESYDLRIAEQLFQDAVADLLARARPLGIEGIALPVGQDFLHVDNLANTTEKGTAQDVDTRLPKVFEAAFLSVIRAVDLCQAVAPTGVIWVPGNHDRHTSYFLCRELAAYYRNSKRVSVDVDPAPRKRLRWGRCLIGYTHGEDENHRDLPSIMASEWPDDWAAALWREWHVGHWHKRKETVYTAGDTFNGCRVQVLPSLCGTDAWHHRKGYVKSGRAAEARVFHRDQGPVALFSYNVPGSFGAGRTAQAA